MSIEYKIQEHEKSGVSRIMANNSKEYAIENVVTIGSAIRAIKENNNIKLKELSNEILHDASVFQDELSLSIAVIIYSLSKIIDRKGNISLAIIVSLEKLKIDLQQQNESMSKRTLNSLVQKIGQEDNKLRTYIVEVLDQAKIKKGGKLYDLGLSISKSAELLGVSYWELASYVGKTTSGDVKPRISSRERVKYTIKLFQ